MDYIYNYFEKEKEEPNHNNPTRKRRTLILFDDTVGDIMANKKFQAIIKEPLIRSKKKIYL